ncbi:MAG TPA: VOC family protein [Candidatus Eisenbacteria bacterium]
MTTGPRKFHDFCWTNMLTPQPARAQEFFTKVLGWSYGEIPGMGHLLKVDGHNMGAMFDTEGQFSMQGAPPHIGVLIKVADVDATAARVNALGGKAQAPFDVGPNGRMAVCFDPSGANFDVWQEGQQATRTDDSTHHGAASWFECLTTDPAACVSFYTELFGWTTRVMSMPGFEYTVFALDGAPVAGCMILMPESGGTKPHWSTVFTIDDADKAAALTAELGGTVIMPPHDVPGVGRASVLKSPQGVVFQVIKYSS